MLTQLLGLSYAEAADGCPVGTIRSRVERAQSDLVDSLGGVTADDAEGDAAHPEA